jgi:hypothetical protein
MSTLQRTLRYGGTAASAPVKAVDIQFQVPFYEYYEEDGAGGEISRRIAATEPESIATPISAQTYRVDLGSEFLAGKDPRLFRRYLAASILSRALDNFIVGVDVAYVANGQSVIGKESLELLFFPRLDLDLPQRGDIAELSDAFILINKAAFADLSRRLTAAGNPLDPILLLSVISFLTDPAARYPAPIADLSDSGTGRLVEMLTGAGVADPPALLRTIKTDFGALVDVPLTIPRVESVRIAGTLTIEIGDAPPATREDFLSYELSAQFSIRETGDLQILRYRFSRDVVVTNNSAPFSFDDQGPVLRESIDPTITVQVKDGTSVPWSKVFKAGDPGLATIDIKVPLHRGNRVVPSDTAIIPAVPKKLRGQVLQLGTSCVLKDLSVLLQAKTAADQPWRTVGAARTDKDGNFSMLYPSASSRPRRRSCR